MIDKKIDVGPEWKQWEAILFHIVVRIRRVFIAVENLVKKYNSELEERKL